ncbi:MAG: ABC transporter ATP-binding protein [Syntrophales bacterium]
MHGSDEPSGRNPDRNHPFLEVDGVSKRFGAIEAVSGVSLRVSEGAIYGLVGSDGAGKSTLLRMIASMIRPDSGSILIGGLDAVRRKTEIKELIGYMPQRFGLYQDLTVKENIDFFMDIFGVPDEERKKRRERYLGFSNLLPFVDRLAGNLSGGMKQKLGLACVLVHEPRLLILDEPTNGVDPVSRQEFWEMLAEMRGQGMSIMVSTSYIDEGEKCDLLALMHRSRLLACGAPGEIKAEYNDLEEAIIHRIEQVDKELIHDRFRF